MDFINTIGNMLPADLSAGRMLESIVLLTIIWRKLRPHLEKIEKRLEGLEGAVTTGFNAGEQRFTKIEQRINVLESSKQQPLGGLQHEGPYRI